jgi:hypothetical protein
MFSRRRRDAEKPPIRIAPAFPEAPCPRESAGVQFEEPRSLTEARRHGEITGAGALAFLRVSAAQRENPGFAWENPECSRGGAGTRRNPPSELLLPSPRLRVPVRVQGFSSKNPALSRRHGDTGRSLERVLWHFSAPPRLSERIVVSLGKTQDVLAEAQGRGETPSELLLASPWPRKRTGCLSAKQPILSRRHGDTGKAGRQVLRRDSVLPCEVSGARDSQAAERRSFPAQQAGSGIWRDRSQMKAAAAGRLCP